MQESSVDVRTGMQRSPLLHRVDEREVRYVETADVGDVLPQRHIALDTLAIELVRAVSGAMLHIT
jgi:hypothetical protein